ncbi:PPK2 family polyphosphate kinase [Fulvivirga sedimenti]|uniref:Polyphosphate kinase n=1 Tax=Fulvivirga sedimenti TaxID=2879465 RepID=A0A9X1HPS9_9BACT|nr:PPK2 family polyphosphate kinase [Fulvivirga sedimenti]MCA6073972.1 polyphosphate kinase [Fulvivirga sedimenti]
MTEIKLAEISTLPPGDLDKEPIEDATKKITKEIEDLQEIMQAQRKYSLLVVMQGMDASGKDSAVKKVFDEIGPAGIKVQAFKKPTEEEMSHDFLWRVHKHVPEKGMIQVFNRSHYEDVLIQRVHKWIDEKTVMKRFSHINNFERLLQDSNTVVIKFYLHISKDQQLIELNERISDPKKFYKHNENDFNERQHWDEYMSAYEDVFKNCGPEIPWHIIPSDRNWYKEYCMASAILEALRALPLEYPPKQG